MTETPQNRTPLALHAAAMAVVVTLFYAAIIARGETLASGDRLTRTLAAFAHVGDAAAAGRIAEWWSSVSLGIPFAADMAHAAWYPLAWLAALLPAPIGLDVFALLHVWLAAVGVSVLSQQLGADIRGAITAGGAAVLAAPMVGLAASGLTIASLAWLPWIACAAARLAVAQPGWQRLDRLLLLAAAHAVQLYAGAWTFVAPAVSLSLVVVVYSRSPIESLRRMTAWLVAMVLATLAAAPVWIAAWAMARPLAEPPRGFAGWSAVVLPVSSSQLVGLHVGLAVLLLTALALAKSGTARRWWAVVVVLAAVAALVPPAWLVQAMPGERQVDPQTVWLASALLICIALAGTGLTCGALGLSRRWTWMGAAALLVAIAASVWQGEFALPAHVLVAIGFSLGGAALMWTCLACARRSSRRSWAVPLAAASLVVSLWPAATQWRRTVGRQLIAQPPQVLDTIARAAAARAAARPRVHRPARLPGDAASPEPTDGPNDELDDEAEILASWVRHRHNALAEVSATRFGVDYFTGADGELAALVRDAAVSVERVLDLFAVDYVLVPASVALPGGRPVVGRTPDDELVLVENELRRPRAFVTSRWRGHASVASARRALLGAGAVAAPLRLSEIQLELGREGEALTPPATPAPLQACAVEEPTDERVVLRCHAAAAGYVVLLDAFAPGWSALVDGIPTPITRAETLARAVKVGAGEHVIEMRYRLPGVRLGAAVALLAWLNLIALGALARWRQRAAFASA